MSFVINKKSKRGGKIRNLYYLVESYRDGKKVKRRTLLKLGEEPDVFGVLDKLSRNEKILKKNLVTYANELKKIGKSQDIKKIMLRIRLDSMKRSMLKRLKRTGETISEIERILKDHPYCSAKKS